MDNTAFLRLHNHVVNLLVERHPPSLPYLVTPKSNFAGDLRDVDVIDGTAIVLDEAPVQIIMRWVAEHVRERTQYGGDASTTQVVLGDEAYARLVRFVYFNPDERWE